jgi:hypothetical protein
MPDMLLLKRQLHIRTWHHIKLTYKLDKILSFCNKSHGHNYHASIKTCSYTFVASIYPINEYTFPLFTFYEPWTNHHTNFVTRENES